MEGTREGAEGSREWSASLLEGSNNSTSRLWTVHVDREDLEQGKGVEGGDTPLLMQRNLLEMNSVNSYMQGTLKNLLEIRNSKREVETPQNLRALYRI